MGENCEEVFGVYKITVIAARWTHFGGEWEGQTFGIKKEN